MIKIQQEDIPNTLELFEDFGLVISTQSNKILCLELMQDDFRFLAGDDQGYLFVWDSFTLSLILKFQAHTNRLYRLTSSKSDNIIITCSLDCTIGVWDWHDYSLIAKISSSYIPFSVKIVSDSKIFVVGCKWGYLAIYSLETLEIIFSKKICHKEIWQIDVDCTNTILVMATFDRISIAFNLDHLIQSHSYNCVSSLTCICISNHFNYYITGEMNGCLTVFGLNDSRIVHINKQAHSDSIRDLIISPDGKKIITASSDHTMAVWEVNELKKLSNIKVHCAYVNCIIANWNEGSIISASWDGTIKLTDIVSGRLETEASIHVAKLKFLLKDNANDLAYSCDKYGCLKAWDLANRRFIGNIHRDLEFCCDGIAYLKQFLIVSNKFGFVYVFKSNFK